jgi:type II protein arginine methyltransferase
LQNDLSIIIIRVGADVIENVSSELRRSGQLQINNGPRPRDFPAWHFAMLNDRHRMAAIEATIADQHLAGKTVFEIGTGSGIIALLFAKHGAAHVLTCELHPKLAEVATDIIGATPYHDRITVVPGSSREVLERGLLSRSPDIIFTETVDCGVVGEGFFAIRADIAKAAARDTVVLPISIEQHGAIVEAQTMRGLNEVHEVAGFDLSPFNRFSTRHYFPVRARLHEPEALSEPKLVRTYRYLGAISSGSTTIEVTRAGMAHGLLSWFEMNFGAHSISTGPQMESHWHQAFHPFAWPIPVHAGEQRQLRIDDTGTASLMCPSSTVK